jgi:ABC-2 type transport system ATP-binding protein
MREGTMTGLAIRAQGLSKAFGAVQAVQRLDLEVRRGEIYGFLGRNGAGKTTTIRMLLGLIRPDSGEVSILGSPLSRAREEALAKVGFLVESASAYPNLTVRENLDIQRRLTASPRDSVDKAIDLLGLGDYAKRQAGKLSLGNKQRLSLARAILHAPELLILDEPANALDPAGIVEIRGLLRRLATEEGVTVFMSSHLLDEVGQLADRIAVVHQGRLVEEVDSAGLAASRRRAIEVEVDDPARAEALLRATLGLSRIRREGGVLMIDDAEAKPQEVARSLVEAGFALSRLETVGENLEEHFMRLTGGNP